MSDQSTPRIIAIGGGKGGVGKSLLSANLGVELANRGRRVAVVDCDLGGANLHSYLGVHHPDASLGRFISREIELLADLLEPTGIKGLQLLAGAQNTAASANVMYQQKKRLLSHLRKLPVDTVILDLGAGTDANVTDFFLAADFGLVIAIPEPTSVDNLYRFVKAAFARHLRMDSSKAMRELISGFEGNLDMLELTPVGLARRARSASPKLGLEAEAKLAAFKPQLVVNDLRDPEDRQLGVQVAATARKLLGVELGFLGNIHHDPHAWRSLRSGRPLLSDREVGPFAAEIGAVARGLEELGL